MNDENLKPFPKGVSGNPHGRPKKLPGLDELLETVLGEQKQGKTAAEAILVALRTKAKRGDTKAAEILLDRFYGKAKQAISFTDPDGNALTPTININVIQPDKSSSL